MVASNATATEADDGDVGQDGPTDAYVELVEVVNSTKIGARSQKHVSLYCCCHVSGCACLLIIWSSEHLVIKDAVSREYLLQQNCDFKIFLSAIGLVAITAFGQHFVRELYSIELTFYDRALVYPCLPSSLPTSLHHYINNQWTQRQ